MIITASRNMGSAPRLGATNFPGLRATQCLVSLVSLYHLYLASCILYLVSRISYLISRISYLVISYLVSPISYLGRSNTPEAETGPDGTVLYRCGLSMAQKTYVMLSVIMHQKLRPARASAFAFADRMVLTVWLPGRGRHGDGVSRSYRRHEARVEA